MPKKMILVHKIGFGFTVCYKKDSLIFYRLCNQAVEKSKEFKEFSIGLDLKDDLCP